MIFLSIELEKTRRGSVLLLGPALSVSEQFYYLLLIVVWLWSLKLCRMNYCVFVCVSVLQFFSIPQMHADSVRIQINQKMGFIFIMMRKKGEIQLYPELPPGSLTRQSTDLS